MSSVCERYGLSPMPPSAGDKMGVSLNLKSGFPIFGLRHNSSPGMSGWFVWVGEKTDADDFFHPLHVDHIENWRAEVKEYLELPPGHCFAIEEDGREFVWREDSLLLD